MDRTAAKWSLQGRVLGDWGQLDERIYHGPARATEGQPAGKGELEMEVFDAIRTLLAVRAYRDEPVPDDVVRRILEAGRMSGGAGNRQPW